MAADLLRQLVYGLLLVLMGAVLWTTAWANQLELRARTAWSQPLVSNAVADETPTTRPAE